MGATHVRCSRRYMTALVSTAFVGHLGSSVLSSVVTAASLYNVTGLSLLIGLASAMETLCGQAFGAKNYRMLGLELQRATLICLVACIPISIFWQHSAPVLTMVGEGF